MKASRKGQRGFTLIEISVVLFILAALIVLAVPTFSWAVDKSRQKACVSNLRQIGIALNTWMQDNDGNLPDMKSMRADKSDEVPVLDTVLLSYTDDPKIFHCPADEGVWESSGCSYWWYEGVTMKADGSHNYKMVESVFLGTRDPSKIPLIMDKQGFHPAPSKINAYYADGHAGPLLEPKPEAP